MGNPVYEQIQASPQIRGGRFPSPYLTTTDGLLSPLVAATVCCIGAPEFCILSARQADTREAAARIARNGTINMLWRACAMIGA